MAITPFSAVPSRATGQDTFSADVETFWGQLPTFVNEVNAFGAGLSSQITTSSTTSLLVGTGSKTLTVGTGLGFQVGMPVRLAFSDTVYMTGTVTSYNPTTGELICNIASSTGSGTYAVWAVYAIPASVTNVPDGDKGDIVVSLNGIVWTIDNEVKTDKIQPITASVASNALTITLNPTVLDFRSATLSSGVVNTRAINSAISTVISSGSTLGTVNAVQSRLAVLAIDNAGTVELAVVNMSGGNQLDETNLITTVAEGGAGGADSANVIYSTTARTNVPYRVVGYVESTQATAGTWATAPSTIQGYGGQALAAMSSLGYGQTWQDVAGSRSAGTTYYNTTGKPIYISVIASTTVANGANILMTVNGLNVNAVGQAQNAVVSLTATAIIPVGGSYSISVAGATVANWNELR